MTLLLEIRVPGLPIAQPRHQIGVKTLADGRAIPVKWLPRVNGQEHPVVAFKTTIRIMVQEARGAGAPVIEDAVRVEIVAVFPRPKVLTKKTTTNPRQPHTMRPDADNIAKAVLDAMRGALWNDDDQVAQLEVAKWIGEPGEPGETTIRVRLLEAPVRTKVATARASQEEKGLFT